MEFRIFFFPSVAQSPFPFSLFLLPLLPVCHSIPATLAWLGNLLPSSFIRLGAALFVVVLVAL